jgi:uncharacterized paraquat-inducible protein A
MGAGAQELGRRLLWSAVAAYAGSVLGMLVFALGRPQLRMFHPMIVVGVMAGAWMTPGANIVLVATMVFGYVYLRTRMPLWTSCVILVGFAAMGCWSAYVWTAR